MMVAIALSWRSCWYATPLSDSEIETLLAGEGSDSRIQKALFQVKERIQAGDGDASRFYPLLSGLVTHETPQIRSTVAWVMGAAPDYAAFEAQLLKLLADAEPLVRYNAATSLGARGVEAARPTLRAMLDVHLVTAPASGTFRKPRSLGESVRFGQIIGRIEVDGGKTVDVVSSLVGRVGKLRIKHGQRVEKGAVLLEIRPPDGQVENALLALSKVGRADDRPAVQRIVEGHLQVSEGTRRLAEKTLSALPQ